MLFCRTGAHDTTSWISDFVPTGAARPEAGGIDRIDRVALTQPFGSFDEVQRVGGYAGYGEVNGPIRMAAHRRRREAQK